MLGQASAIKVRNQVSEYPPLSKLAGCFYVLWYWLQRYEKKHIFDTFLHSFFIFSAYSWNKWWFIGTYQPRYWYEGRGD
jgi:hypothetical protein